MIARLLTFMLVMLLAFWSAVLGQESNSTPTTFEIAKAQGNRIMGSTPEGRLSFGAYLPNKSVMISNVHCTAALTSLADQIWIIDIKRPLGDSLYEVSVSGSRLTGGAAVQYTDTVNLRVSDFVIPDRIRSNDADFRADSLFRISWTAGIYTAQDDQYILVQNETSVNVSFGGGLFTEAAPKDWSFTTLFRSDTIGYLYPAGHVSAAVPGNRANVIIFMDVHLVNSSTAAMTKVGYQVKHTDGTAGWGPASALRFMNDSTSALFDSLWIPPGYPLNLTVGDSIPEADSLRLILYPYEADKRWVLDSLGVRIGK